MMESSRARILDTSADMFAAHGYAAISVRRIAKAARVHESTILRLFKSKHGLALAIVARATELLISEMHPDQIAKSELACAAELYARWYAHRITARTVRLWAVFAIENPRAVILNVMQAHTAMIEKVRSSQAAGVVIAGNPKAMLRVLHSAIVGNAILRALDHPIVDRNQSYNLDISTIVKVWIRGVSPVAQQ